MASNDESRTLELLAPARDAATAIAAIDHGADAVYIGGPSFGARAAAGNSVEDIRRVAEYAHQFGARVYVTLNTIIFDSELAAAEELVAKLHAAGVDALIVQDMSLLSMDIPPIDLHASTQCDSRTPAKVERLARAGFSQIVVPRELSLDQIRQAAKAAGDSAVEVFVHGALCVSYSGDCHAGYALAGRSANRGECPQICRLKFRLVDADGRAVALPDGGSAERHWLSLADMNRLDSLTELADAGARSFKIEGRLKSVDYVKNVTAAYSQALDRVVAASSGKYRRASLGRSELKFTPDTTRSFNRGFTRYFLDCAAETGITSWRTPKWIGLPVAKIVQISEKYIRVRATAELHNGDGLGWFDASGAFAGFRVNRVDGDRIYPAPGSKMPPKSVTTLYRNADTQFDALMARNDTARRTIAVDFVLRRIPDGRIAIDAADERGCKISVASSATFADAARTPQQAQRRDILGRLGDSIYRLGDVDDRLAELFVPSSAMADLRRTALAALDSAWRMHFSRAVRRKSSLPADALAGVVADYHDNVANAAARRFYTDHGAEVAESALEAASKSGELRVMTTRYCIRRELGACLRTPQASRLPVSDLYFEAPIGRLRIKFDCANCQMCLFTRNNSKCQK